MFDWITVREAAFMMGYSPEYFRRVFCSPDAPLVKIREWRGPNGGRRVMVSRLALLRLMSEQTNEPCG